MNDKKDMLKDQDKAVEAVTEELAPIEDDEEDSLIITLKKPYTFEGKDYTEIDLSGLENLNASDMIKVNKRMNRASGGSSELLPEFSLEYALYLASIATKLPVEFFLNLPPRVALKVKTRVTGFLFGTD